MHPDGRHLLYTLGSCVVIREIGNPRATEFLTGHSDKVSCLAISKSGRYIAVGLDNKEDMYDFSLQTTPDNFSPQSLRKRGIR